MYTYAIEEVQDILHRIDTDMSMSQKEQRDKLNYICAMFAELAYHHVPEAEIGSNKRAKLISSEAYKQIIKREMASSADITPYVSRQRNEGELPQSFIVTTEQIVAIGHVFGNRLFIAFRGTKFTLGADWYTNFQAKKVPIPRGGFPWTKRIFGRNPGLFHRGFLKEAHRISDLIDAELIIRSFSHVEKVYLSGHSLGGAVAFISQQFLGVDQIAGIFIYGAPRSCNVRGCIDRTFKYPIQVRHAGDPVPTVPPLTFRYVDYPLELNTDGNHYRDPDFLECPFTSIFRWLWCLCGLGRSHFMEIYRKELGVTAGALGAELELVPMKRLTNKQLK
ncbi:TPA: hypothetical protein RFT16_003230 [Klebsiella pneumoniae subsp. pneumoniae]|nr:hypothetical protein [Klebsiella pneumoniae subsp. pneumoniae]